MKDAELRQELERYGHKLMAAGLVAGAGGNMSARAGRIVYISPSGLGFDELDAAGYIGVDLDSGKVVEGEGKATSEVEMHLGCYRKRGDITALVHTHSPWASGVASAGVELKAMFPEFVCDIENLAHIGYVVPTTEKLAAAVCKVIVEANAVLMSNHGVIAVGQTLKEAFNRAVVIEDAAKSMMIAAIVGKPRWLTEKEIEEINELPAVRYRREVAKQK